MFSEKATKNLNLDLSFTGNHQIKDVKCLFCGILRKHEFYLVHVNVVKLTHCASNFQNGKSRTGCFLTHMFNSLCFQTKEKQKT